MTRNLSKCGHTITKFIFFKTVLTVGDKKFILKEAYRWECQCSVTHFGDSIKDRFRTSILAYLRDCWTSGECVRLVESERCSSAQLFVPITLLGVNSPAIL